MSIDYHRSELAIAQDPSHPAHILPPPLPAGSRILDVGCGAGQTLIAAYPHCLSTGVDVDFEALAIGRTWNSQIQFVQARAEALPFPEGSFDAVVARVSLAYTELPQSLREIRRVLKSGGTVWMVLHPFAIPLATARAGSLRAWVFFAYIAVNSVLFHFAGTTFRFRGRCETFQTRKGIERALVKQGFKNLQISYGRHFVATAVAA